MTPKIHNDPDCGQQHLKLALGIVSLVMAICTATIAYTASITNALDARVRMVEQTATRNSERYQAILDRLGAIDRSLERASPNPWGLEKKP